MFHQVGAVILTQLEYLPHGQCKPPRALLCICLITNPDVLLPKVDYNMLQWDGRRSRRPVDFIRGRQMSDRERIRG